MHKKLTIKNLIILLAAIVVIVIAAVFLKKTAGTKPVDPIEEATGIPYEEDQIVEIGDDEAEGGF